MEIPGIPIDQLRHTRAAQELLEEGRKEGLMQAFRERGMAALILRQLNRRCGPITPATRVKIQALPLEQLETLADALLDFAGPQDLAIWLAAHSNV